MLSNRSAAMILGLELFKMLIHIKKVCTLKFKICQSIHVCKVSRYGVAATLISFVWRWNIEKKMLQIDLQTRKRNTAAITQYF